MNNFLDFLRQITYISAQEFEEAMLLFTKKKMKKGGIFIQQDKVCRQIAFICSGTLRTYYVNDKGEEITSCFCTENTLTTSYKSFILQQPSDLALQAMEDVKSGYADIVKRNTQKPFLSNIFQCCDPKAIATDIGKKIGYSEDELKNVPEDANLGIGCGNPTALASIKKGETILDLGSGAGFDCFLASRETGKTGKVIGVDITPEMVLQAQKNAKQGSYGNVEFKLGEIENLPVASNSIDLIISNCVINLSNQKEQVFKEAYRVAKPNGRIMISDVILLEDLPDYVKNSVEGHIACLAGAVRLEDYMIAISKAGFTDIRVDKKAPFPIELMLNDPIAKKIVNENNLTETEVQVIANSIASVLISANK